MFYHDARVASRTNTHGTLFWQNKEALDAHPSAVGTSKCLISVRSMHIPPRERQQQYDVQPREYESRCVGDRDHWCDDRNQHKVAQQHGAQCGMLPLRSLSQCWDRPCQVS